VSGRSPSGRATRASTEPASGLGHSASVPNAEKWAAFDAEVERRQHLNAPPFFVAGHDGGDWYIQYLYRPSVPTFGKLRRLFPPPTLKRLDYEAYYNGWPGDNRGWMSFRSANEAIDFFRFSTGRVSFDEYCERERPEMGPYRRIDLDANGDALPASAIEARRAETHSGSVADESAVAKPDAQTQPPSPPSGHP